MKRTLLTLVLLLAFVSLFAADINHIATAFKKGDAASLLSCLDREVEVVLPSVNKKCAGNEAVKLLDAFFRQNSPSGFSILHRADKKESGFCVGKLSSSGGEFRVNVTYRTQNNDILIQSIRIE